LLFPVRNSIFPEPEPEFLVVFDPEFHVNSGFRDFSRFRRNYRSPATGTGIRRKQLSHQVITKLEKMSVYHPIHSSTVSLSPARDAWQEDSFSGSEKDPSPPSIKPQRNAHGNNTPWILRQSLKDAPGHVGVEFRRVHWQSSCHIDDKLSCFLATGNSGGIYPEFWVKNDRKLTFRFQKNGIPDRK
jgi:hypothetical protein